MSDNRLSFVSPITPPGRDAFYSSIPVVWSDPTDCIICLTCARDTSTEPVTNEVVIPKPARVYPEQMLYTNSQQVIECDLGGSYTVPAGLFGSNTSQAEADAQAVTYGTNICNGNYWNTSQSVTCIGGSTSTVPDHLFYSSASQAAANALALAAASANCSAASLNNLIWYMPCAGAHNIPDGSCPVPPTPVVTTAVMGGTAGHLYNVGLLFRGIVEKCVYGGGTKNGNFYTGGSSVSGPANIYSLTVSDPAQVYYFNAFDTIFPIDTQIIDYMETIPIMAGATVTLTANPSDTYEAYNHDDLGNPESAPDNVAGHPIGVTQPYNGQFVQMDVISVT